MQNANYQLSSTANYGGATSIQVLNGGATTIGSSGTYSIPMTIAGSGVQMYWSGTDYPGRGAIEINPPSGSAVTLAGPITLAANARIDSVSYPDTTTITGVISGAYQLEIGSDGTPSPTYYVLAASAGSNSFSTLKTDSFEVITAGNANAFSGLLYMTGNGTIATGGYNVSFSNISGGASGSSVIQNGIATPSTLTVGADNSSQMFSGTIQNGGSGALRWSRLAPVRCCSKAPAATAAALCLTPE